MKKSDRTKKCKRMSILFSILHFLCLFGPLAYYVPYGFISGETVEKVSMSFAVIVSVILAMLSIVIDVKHRAGLHKSIMWFLIAGTLFCLEDIKVFVLIMAATSIIDELIFTRAREHYATAYTANIEIDRRQL